MHGSKAAKVTDESEYSGRRKTLLPRLANSKDWRQWAFKTETILKQKELWYVIENAAPAREVVALSANETARLPPHTVVQLSCLVLAQWAQRHCTYSPPLGSTFRASQTAIPRLFAPFPRLEARNPRSAYSAPGTKIREARKTPGLRYRRSGPIASRV